MREQRGAGAKAGREDTEPIKRTVFGELEEALQGSTVIVNPDTYYAYDIPPVPNDPEIQKIVVGFLLADVILLTSFFDHYTIVRDN